MNVKHVINWTATYRHDSDIVTPYEKFFHLSSPSLSPAEADAPVTVGDRHDRSREMDQQETLATAVRPAATAVNRKANKVAWFVSNCGARNKRLEYARELGRYIDVDIFGS